MSNGNRLRLARQARGFSQQQVASMAGVSRQAVSAVESGISDPSLRVAIALSRALGLTVEELFGVVTGTIANADRRIRPLLDQRRHVIEPAGTSFKTLAELNAYAAAHGVTLTPGTKAAS